MRCPRCQHENPIGQKFCGECGIRLGQGDGTARFWTPQSEIPRHLAEKILTSKLALEGERKQVTVLFADLKGSMELMADRDPEEARKLLDPVIEHMMEAVHRYEGTVNQVMGDGIMALFGAPIAHEDHAVRACYAALRMQELMTRYAEEARHTHGVNVQIRVGLNSGEVVVRSIGSDLHMDYTAVVQTTHLAGRMEQLANPGSILLTSSLGARRRFRRREAIGPPAGQGPGRPSADLRGDGRGPGEDTFAGYCSARSHAIRRPRRRTGAISSYAAAGSQRAWPDSGNRRRGGGRQVAPHSRIHPRSLSAGLAGRQGRIGLLRQADDLPAGDRPPQGLLEDPGRRRPSRDPREGDGQAAHARPCA